MKKEAKIALGVASAVVVALIGFIATQSKPSAKPDQPQAEQAQKASTEGAAASAVPAAPEAPVLIKEAVPATPPVATGGEAPAANPSQNTLNASAPTSTNGANGAVAATNGTPVAATTTTDPNKKTEEKKETNASTAADPLPATHLAKENCAGKSKPAARSAKKPVKRYAKAVKRKASSAKLPAPSLTVYAEQGGRIWVAASETNGSNMQSYAVGDKMPNGAVIKSVKRSNKPSGRAFVIQTDKGTVVAR